MKKKTNSIMKEINLKEIDSTETDTKKDTDTTEITNYASGLQRTKTTIKGYDANFLYI